MRDIALTLIVFGFIPYILIKPQVGIYVWSWLSYMNPHRYTYGFAYTMPFAQSVAIATLMGILFWKEPKRIPGTGLIILWVLFLIWMAVTTVFAFYGYSTDQLIKVYKIQLVTFLTIMLIKSKKDINILVWVIALSVGFFGIKGGIFTLQTLGAYRVWGPPGSFIEDNNELALALLMTLPLFYYLKSQLKAAWQKWIIVILMLLIAISAFGSQSRGAFLAAGATGFFLWLKTPNKIVTGFLLIVLGIGVISFMPQSWHDRMSTITNYEEDSSAMGRIEAWKMATNLANSRITGGGFSMWSPMVYQRYSNNPSTWNARTAAHSIYFSILGEHGWPGLLLFLGVLFAAWRTSVLIIKKSAKDISLKWLADLTRMIQVSLVTYMAGGAFLSLSYFDLPWHLISILVIGRVLVEEQQANSDKIRALGEITPTIR
jgi:probable O-glycosylation ligase (exosortase A-associated)